LGQSTGSACIAWNWRTRRVKRKQGLHLDGWHDMHLHALLADDVRS